jgi:hypothetical protein
MKTENHQLPLAQPSDAQRQHKGSETAAASSQVRGASFRGRSQGTRQQLSHPRLCWTRHELVQATGLCYRTIINLERRGLLKRIPAGINVALYSDASVRALFSEPTARGEECA